QPLDDCPVMARQRPRAATAHSFRMRFWATKYSFRANCQPGSDCRLFELGRVSQEATERLSTCGRSDVSMPVTSRLDVGTRVSLGAGFRGHRESLLPQDLARLHHAIPRVARGFQQPQMVRVEVVIGDDSAPPRLHCGTQMIGGWR